MNLNVSTDKPIAVNLVVDKPIEVKLGADVAVTKLPPIQANARIGIIQRPPKILEPQGAVEPEHLRCVRLAD